MRVGIIIAVMGLLMQGAAPLLASEAAAEGETTPSVFEGYFGESIWALVWFFALLAVLWKFAWKPLLAGLVLRQEHIERQLTDAEKTRAEAKKVLEDYHAKLSDADRQGRDIISSRVKEAEKQAHEVEVVKRQEIEQIKERAELDLQRQELEAQEALWQQAGEIVRQLGSEVFGRSLTEQDNQKLIDEAIAKLRSQAGGQTKSNS
jgi:F-type H+-transporting ATPase subunit b